MFHTIGKKFLEASCSDSHSYESFESVSCSEQDLPFYLEQNTRGDLARAKETFTALQELM